MNVELYEVFTIFNQHFVDVLAHEGRGVALLADEQDVAFLSDDVAVETIDDAELALGELDDIVVRVVEHDFGVDNDIVGIAMAHELVDGMPRAKVCPSELALHDVDVVCVLEEGIVDGEVGIAGVVLLDILQLFVVVVGGLLELEVAQHTGEDALKALGELAGVGKEDARVPIELATLHEHLGKGTLGFLCERLDLEDVGFAAEVAHLDIAVAWLGARGLDTHGEEDIVVGDVVETCLYAADEGCLVDDELVSRGDDDVGIGVAALDAHVGPRHAGCRIAVDGFYEDVAFVDVGDLLLDEGEVLLTGADEDVLQGDDLGEAVERGLQLGASSAEEIDELLGAVLTAARPQATSFSSR